MFTVSKRWRGADVKVVCIGSTRRLPRGLTPAFTSEPPKPIKNDADTDSHKDARVQDKRIPRCLKPSEKPIFQCSGNISLQRYPRK